MCKKLFRKQKQYREPVSHGAEKHEDVPDAVVEAARIMGKEVGA